MLLRNIRKFGNTPLSIAEIFTPKLACGLHEFSGIIAQFNAYSFNFKGAMFVPLSVSPTSVETATNMLTNYSIDTSKALQSSVHISVFNQLKDEYIVKLLVSRNSARVMTNLFIPTSKSQSHMFIEALDVLNDMYVRCK